MTLDDTAEDLFDSIRRYMVVTDSEEIPEDFPLLDFAMMMGEFGRIDSANYQRIREEAFLKRKDEENANNSDSQSTEDDEESSQESVDSQSDSESQGDPDNNPPPNEIAEPADPDAE